MKDKMQFLYKCKINIQITDVDVTDVSHGIYDTFLCINLNESRWIQNHTILFIEEIKYDHYLALFRENDSL
jgi:hypothetical protein